MSSSAVKRASAPAARGEQPAPAMNIRDGADAECFARHQVFGSVALVVEIKKTPAAGLYINAKAGAETKTDADPGQTSLGCFNVLQR